MNNSSKYKTIRLFLLLVIMMPFLNSCRQAGKEVSEGIIKKGARILSINIGEEISEKVSRQIAKENLSEVAKKELRSDISKYKVLRRLFETNTNTLKAYKELSHLPEKFRTDERLIKWRLFNMERPENTLRKDFHKISLVPDELNQKLLLKQDGKIVGEYANGVVKCRAGRALPGTSKTVVNKFLNAELIPNTSYIVDNKFVYKTDNLGRVFSSNNIKPLTLVDRGRDIRTQSWVNTVKNGILREGRGESDNAGHAIAQRLDGPSEMINFFPQLPAMNIGDWKTMENTLVKAVQDGKKVFIKQTFHYADGSMRPSSIRVEYRINKGIPRVLNFNN